MLTRPLFPKQRDVFLVVDTPTRSELEEGDAFSAPSNMNLLTSLRTGKLYASAKTQEIKGILPTKIYKTYLDYRDKTEYDYKDSFCKRKDLIELTFDEEFVELIKDSYASNDDGNDLLEKVVIKKGVTYYVKKEDNNIDKNYVLENSWHKLEHQKDCFVKKELWTEFQNLLEEIRKVEPRLIIVTGKWAFFFLSGVVTLTGTQGTLKDKKILGGLAKFRSSSMLIWEGFNIQNHVLIPIWHTLNAVTMQDKTFIILADIQKVIWAYYTIIEKGVEFFTEVKHEYLIGTNKEQILNYFDELLNLNHVVIISIDIETMFQDVIDCIGFSYENNRGLCVPFCSADNNSVWSYEDELEITLKMFEVLNSKQVQFNTVGQNFSYDAQYIYRFYGIKVNAKHDTMILNHVLFNYLPKDLAFLASIYCPRYKYWKDEIAADKESPETRWEYNVKDICWTREILEAQLDILSTRPEKQQEFYEFQANNIAPCLQEMMYIGVKVDKDKKEVLHNKLKEVLEQIEATINSIFQYSIPNIEINLKSPKQIGTLFTDLLKIKPIIDKKRKTVTFGSDAMLVYRDENPEYYPLITLILEYRSIGIFVRTFLGAELDEDDRLRTAYNAAGTKSYRLSSRKNAFGKGLNMSNIPSKGKIALNYSLDLESIDNENELEGLEDIRLIEEESITKLPNCKEIFLPDEGTVFWNADYSGADAMVVAADSNCEFLLNFFATSKEKLYIYIAREYLQRDITSDDPFYKKAKQFVHLCLTGDHEVLTPNGWVRLDQLKQNIPVITWLNGKLAFEIPLEYTEGNYEGNLIGLEGKLSILGTPTHRQIAYDSRKNTYVEYTLDTLPENHGYLSLISNADYVGGKQEIKESLIQLLVAAQADGTWKNYAKSRLGFNLKKERKIERLTNILFSLSIDFKLTKNNNTTYIECDGTILKQYLDKRKNFNLKELLNLSKIYLITFIEELQFWDAYKNKKDSISYATINKDNAITIQTIGSLCNFHVSLAESYQEGKQLLYRLTLSKLVSCSVRRHKKTKIPYKGKVYCVTVSSSYFLIRYKNSIMVTGNTNYGGMEAKAAASSGLDIVTARNLRNWYFSKCPEILEWHKRIASEVNSRGYIENIFGARFYLLDKNCPTLLNQAYSLIPQSTIAILINKGIVNIYKNETDLVFRKAKNNNLDRNSIIPLLQVHDAASGVFKDKGDKENDETMKRVVKHLEIELPYQRPLIIPADGSWSRESYGHCK